MPRPAKSRQVVEDGGKSVPPQTQESADLSANNVNTESASAQQVADNINMETESARGAADRTEHEQMSTDEENQTQPGTDKQRPSLTKS